MDIKYYKEQQRSYMALRQTVDEETVSFQRQMLMSRSLPGILAQRPRIADGAKYNYYDITSMTSLKQLFGSREMDSADLGLLLGNIRESCNEADGYMLDPTRICLDPELIFYGYSDKSYHFVYNLSVSVTENETLIQAFMDFLLDRISPSDTVAQDTVYELYERYERGGFDIWDLQIPEKTEEKAFSAPETKDSPAYYDSAEPVPGVVFDEIPVEKSIDRSSPVSLPYDKDDREEPEDDSAARKSVFMIIAFALGLLGMIACAAVFFLFTLEPGEELILYAAAGVSFVIALCGGLFLIRSGMRSRSNAVTEDVPDIFGFDTPEVHMEDFLDRSGRGSARSHAGRAGALTKEKVERRGKADTEAFRGEAPPSDEGGQTVFFEGDLTSELKLYALDRKNKKHIDLDSLPVTIGKMKGYVDVCLDHASISRMHAKLYLEDDKLMIRDLNSTNGVFVNGIRLTPNESREIEEGDEVRFGALSYSLRRR